MTILFPSQWIFFKICKLVRINYANYRIFPRRNHRDNLVSRRNGIYSEYTTCSSLYHGHTHT